MKRAWAFVIATFAPIVAFGACNAENALIGGECATGYELVGNVCVPTCTNCDAGADNAIDSLSEPPSSGDGPTSDVTQADAIVCDDGLTLCSGTCIDTTSDPFNCGGCGIVCPSLLCASSVCQGAVPGSFVVIGHDYELSYSGAQSKLLTNALLLSGAASLRVRSYEQYASATAVTNVKSLLTSAAISAGRTITYTVASAPTDVSVGMTALNTDVLVVYDQVSAPAATLATVGTSWATTLKNFAHVGGIVIALDGAGGTNPQMPALIQAANILDVASDTSVSQGSALDVVAPADAVGLGVVSPYGAGKHSVYFACNELNGGMVAYVVEDPIGDAGPTQPVVVHKVAP